jgi:SAM-dependent methyltransferase
MNLEEYEKMYSLEDTYWWFQGRKHIIFSLLERSGAFEPNVDGSAPVTVDLGCGTGLVLDHLHSRTRPVGLDLSALALTYCRERGIRALARSDATQLPLGDDSTDLILALDLIEHIEDDARVYSEIARSLRPGGRAVISVPAYPFLWSEHDEALHHCRRYTRASLTRLLGGQPLRVERLTYAIAFTFLPIVAFRVLRRLLRRRSAPRTHLIVLPGWMNGALISLLKIEAAMTRWVSFPFGVSLLAVVRKPGER